MKIGDNIRKIREKLGLNQEQLANEIGVTKTSISRYESNLREPNLDTINKLAKFFNINISELINLDDEDIKVLEDNLRLKEENRKLENQIEQLEKEINELINNDKK